MYHLDGPILFSFGTVDRSVERERGDSSLRKWKTVSSVARERERETHLRTHGRHRGTKKKREFELIEFGIECGSGKMSGPSVDVVWDPQAQMNSLDCWDYSIELSCLQGPEGITRDLSFERWWFGAFENVRIKYGCTTDDFVPFFVFIDLVDNFRTSVNESLQRYDCQSFTFPNCTCK